MAGEVGGGERVLAAIVDAHGGVTRSYVTVVVSVKPAMDLATRPYDDNQIMGREVREATVVAGHGRACLWRCTTAMAVTASS